MNTKSLKKMVYILFDEADRSYFESAFDGSRNDSFYFPISYISILDGVYRKNNGDYIFPEMADTQGDEIYTEVTFDITRAFLKNLFETNPWLGMDCNSNHFPLDYYWFCLFTLVHRLIRSCSNLLSRHEIGKVVMAHRHKFINIVGLTVSVYSITRIIENYIASQGITVLAKELCENHPSNNTVFHYGKRTWRSPAKRGLKFLLWKMLAFNRKDYEYILVDPSYDNENNFLGFDTCRNSKRPQVFYDNGVPFYHKTMNIIRYFIDLWSSENTIRKMPAIPSPFSVSIDGFEIDFSAAFPDTIDAYLHVVQKAKHRTLVWWRNLPNHSKIKALIFSLPPVFLDSYFLIEKIRSNSGFVVTFQHGGFYGYAEHPIYQITDYGKSDYFLSYGKSHKDRISMNISKSCKIIEIGTRYMYPLKKSGSLSKRKISTTKCGVYFPAVIGTELSQSRVTWNPYLQFKNQLGIIEFFSSGKYGQIVIKGLPNHKPHIFIKNYLSKANISNVFYTDEKIRKLRLLHSGFVVFDAPSTPLIEIFTRYNGPVFLLNSQASWALHPEAIDLIRKRVHYAETLDDLKKLLNQALMGDSRESVMQDNSFLDRYVKPFSNSKYNLFLSSLGIQTGKSSDKPENDGLYE